MSDFQVQAGPHPWPNTGTIPTGKCALVVIDMQNDYCSRGYYMDKAGYDIERLRRPIEPIKKVIEVARENDFVIVYTRQFNNSDPGTPAGNYPQTARKGESGWEIIPELAPLETDIVIDKTTCSAFVSGGLHEILQGKSIKHIVFCGNTLDVCVHSTLRSANDLGYKCLTLGDCCGAVNEDLHKWSLESIKIEDGVFGAVATSGDFLKALGR